MATVFSPVLTRLCQTLGLTDRNQNASIDATGEEGYLPVADLNLDGKLVASEIRYYALQLGTVPPALLAENPWQPKDAEDIFLSVQDATVEALAAIDETKIASDRQKDPVSRPARLVIEQHMRALTLALNEARLIKSFGLDLDFFRSDLEAVMDSYMFLAHPSKFAWTADDRRLLIEAGDAAVKTIVQSGLFAPDDYARFKVNVDLANQTHRFAMQTPLQAGEDVFTTDNPELQVEIVPMPENIHEILRQQEELKRNPPPPPIPDIK